MRGQEGPRPRPRVWGAHSRASTPCSQCPGLLTLHTWEPDLCCGATPGIKARPQPPPTGFQKHPPPPQQIEQLKMSPEDTQCPWGSVIPRREPGCPPVPQDPQGSSSPVRCLGKCRVWGGAPDSAFLRSSRPHRCFHPPSSAP